MTDFIVREAQPADASELAKLRYALRSRGKYASDSRKDLESEAVFLERCTRWMMKALQQSHWHCWVAERDGELIGALWLQAIEKIPNPSNESESFAYITNFFVREDDRGMGLGSVLLKHALDWSRRERVHSVILWPTENSRSLYERSGFKVPDDLLELIVAKD
jgi:GNAT superfamily N-acetyltransferase